MINTFRGGTLSASDFDGPWTIDVGAGIVTFTPHKTVREKIQACAYSLCVHDGTPEELKQAQANRFKADALKECKLLDHPEAERLWKLAQLPDEPGDTRLEVLERLERIASVWLT